MQPNLSVPQAVAHKRQQAIIAKQSIQSLRIGVASRVYERLAGDKFHSHITALASQARRELDPFGTSQEPVDFEINSNIDTNIEALFAIHAANTFLHHLGMLATEQEVNLELGIGDQGSNGVVLA